MEVAVPQVLRAYLVPGADRSDSPTTPDQAVHSRVAHQPIHGVLGNIREAIALQPGPHLPPPVEDFRLWFSGLRIGLLQVVQDIEDPGIGDGPGRRLALLPAAVSARRDLQALDGQGLACLLDCVAALALLVDEFGD